MKKSWLVAAMMMLASALASAQGGPPAGKGPANRMYDPATVVTVSGTVTGEARIDRGHGHKGVHLTLKTADEELAVHLGPDFWVDQRKVKIAKGDTITVKGSKITFDGGPAVIAQAVTKGGETLILRSPEGAPVWQRPPK